MTHLLWVRTSRGVSTLVDEAVDFEESLREPDSITALEVDEPFVGGDHLLYAIHWPGTIHHLKTVVAPLMRRSWINDWSLTEVGMAVSPADDVDDQHDYRFGVIGDHFGVLRWNRIPESNAFGLWIDLDRERKDRDDIIRRAQQLLPGPATFMWHGRSLILLAYRPIAPRRTPFGFTTDLLQHLGHDDVACWISFQIGNWSVGGAIETMNPMADFIWRSPPQRGNRKRGAK